MISNGDIFDDEELLAIAADGDGSSSSSCHSSTSGSGSDEDNSPIVSTKPSEEIDSVSSEEKEATVPNTSGVGINVQGAKTTAVLTTANEKIIECHRSNSQSQTASIAKDQGEENSNRSSSSDDDDSDDDDDGFLESWFETEKKIATAQSALGDSAQDSKHEDEEIVVTQNNDKPETKSTNNGGEKNIDQHDNAKNRVELGASVLQWVSSAKKFGGNKKRHDNRGVVALQHNHDDEPDFISSTSTLRLTTSSSGNPRKRPRAGADRADATLEEMTLESTSERRVKCGEVAYASDNTGMVNCLARYDSEKGCYVLEIVDLLVNKLEPLSKVAHNELIVDQVAVATNASTIPTQILTTRDQPKMLFDPRSGAKRAEDQIKKLKKGKGRAGPLKKRKQKKDDGLSAENKK